MLDFVLHNISIDDGDTKFMIKGVEFNLLQMFGNDADKAKRYENGTLLLMSLYFHNYHHYHSYCNDAKIEDIDRIDSGYYFCFGVNSTSILNNCSFDDIPACHAYWSHVNNRAIVHMECNSNQQQETFPTALVVVGLGHVSSVDFVVESQDVLLKGDKLGHFAYGGSTISLLFPANTIDEVLIEIGQETKMGQPLARLNNLSVGLKDKVDL